MKIIIDIDEDYVKIINKNGASNYPEEVIINGTPLPKGHGRLIDAKEVYKKFYCRCLAGAATEVLDETPTIIDADKEND